MKILGLYLFVDQILALKAPKLGLFESSTSNKLSGAVSPDYSGLSLNQADDEVFRIIANEQSRQLTGIELIASENFVSAPVLEALSSCLTNKYSEGDKL